MISCHFVIGIYRSWNCLTALFIIVVYDKMTGTTGNGDTYTMQWKWNIKNSSESIVCLVRAFKIFGNTQFVVNGLIVGQIGEKLLGNCALNDTSMESGTQSEYIMRNLLTCIGSLQIWILKNIYRIKRSCQNFQNGCHCLLHYLYFFTGQICGDQ